MGFVQMCGSKMIRIAGASICRWFGLSVVVLLMPIPLACGSVYAPGKDPYHAKQFYLKALRHAKALSGGPLRTFVAQLTAAAPGQNANPFLTPEAQRIQAQKSAAARKRALLDLLEAAYTKNPTAEYYTGLYYLKVRNYRYAITWLTDAAKGGCVRADILLGTEIYNDGVGASVNAKRAQGWLWRAQLTGKDNNPLVGRVYSLLAEHFYFGDGFEPTRHGKLYLATARSLVSEGMRDYRGVANSGQRRLNRLGAIECLRIQLAGRTVTLPKSEAKGPGQRRIKLGFLGYQFTLPKSVAKGPGQRRKYASTVILSNHGGARGRLIAMAELHAGPPLSVLPSVAPLTEVCSAKYLPEDMLLHLVERCRIPRMVKFLSANKTMLIPYGAPGLQAYARRAVIRDIGKILAFIERRKGQRAGAAALALLELRISLLPPGFNLSAAAREKLLRQTGRVFHLSMHDSRTVSFKLNRIAGEYQFILVRKVGLPPYLGGL